jgi:hypothetical protein
MYSLTNLAAIAVAKQCTKGVGAAIYGLLPILPLRLVKYLHPLIEISDQELEALSSGEAIMHFFSSPNWDEFKKEINRRDYGRKLL